MGGSAITTIGSGLMGTFNLHTSQAEWAIYQVLTGVGRGLVLQVVSPIPPSTADETRLIHHVQPIIATQNILEPSEISTGSALVVLFQLFGGAIFISCGQTIFTNRFQAGLLRFAPEVDAQEVVRWGVAQLNLAVPEQSLDHVLQACNYALIRTFYLGVGGSFVAFFTSMGMGWKKLETVKPSDDGTQV